MIAYQMIYTACGKDKSGAFSVWSKSDEITTQECNEIAKVMNYRTPVDAPYEPTEDEIKRLFPPKYGYFALSSGRRCIAKASYIGRVYSELDSRTGNFIIHAYVFDALDGYNPYYIFNSSMFKTCLTEKEWREDTPVDRLPSVELTPEPAPSLSEIKSVADGCGGAFSALLEAIIKSAETSELVMFNDSEANQAKLYTALGTLLPPSVLEKVTFSTQYSLQAEYGLQQGGVVPIKVRNIFEYGQNGSFNYAEKIAAGKLAFDFGKRMGSNITEAHKYVADVIAALSGTSIFPVREMANEVDNIMLSTGYDIDTAYAVYNIVKKRYNKFAGPDEFSAALSAAVSAKLADPKTVASDAYNSFIRSGAWEINASALSVVRSAYDAGDITLKDEIIAWFYNNADKLVSKNQNIRAYVSEFKNAAPFPWAEFVSNVCTSTRWNGIIASINDEYKAYLLYNAALYAYSNRIGDAQKNNDTIIRLFRRTVDAKSPNAVKLYMEDGTAANQGFEQWAADNVFVPLLRVAARDQNDLTFKFGMVESLGSDKAQVQCMGELLLANLNAPDFVKIYAARANQNRALYDNIEKQLANDPRFKQFFTQKETYAFSSAEQVTPDMLQRYHDGGFINASVGGIYVKQLNRYFERQGGSGDNAQKLKYDKLNECFRQYKMFSFGPFANTNAAIEVYCAIDKFVYKNFNMRELVQLKFEQVMMLRGINDSIKRAQRQTSTGYLILSALYNMFGGFGRDEQNRAISSGTFYVDLAQNSLSYIAKQYTDMLIDAYLGLKKVYGEQYFVQLLNLVFDPMFRMVSGFSATLLAAINAADGKKSLELVTDMFDYAYNEINNLAGALRRTLDEYINQLSRGEAKKLFKYMQNNIADARRGGIDNYIDDYNSKNKGIFGWLFGKKDKDKNKK